MSEIVIIDGARTPVGAYMGSLSTIPAPRLGAEAIQAAIQRSGVDKISQVIMGCVLQAGLGQAPARQAAIYAGIDKSTPCSTVHKVCGSGMYSIILAHQSLMLRDATFVVAGGMESMSQSPHFIPNARGGLGLGHGKVLDCMIHDGLWDPYNDMHMGMCGELCANEKKISREDQDAFAIESFKLAIKAKDLHQKEITPVTIKTRKGDIVVSEDECPPKAQFDKIPNLRPAFDKNGSITAANASSINDGAAALILARAEDAKSLNKKPLAKIVAYAGHAGEPEWFTTAPITAVHNVLKKADWSLEDVDLFEINEAFAVVAIAFERELGIARDKINVHGGAIAIGHPIGASGTRIVLSLITALKAQGKSRGVAAICLGGGEALSLAIELI